MTYSGPFFYDDKAVFTTYLKRRQQATSANETLEKPILMALIGNVQGQTILDLGCGEATLARELIQQGATHYHGIDGSSNMVTLAQKNILGLPAQVEKGFIENWEYPPHTFDRVISRMAFHYIENLEPIFRQIHQSLHPKGQLIFSVEHPVITSHQISMKEGKSRQDWVVDRYFITGARRMNWLGADVIKYHRTVEDYYSLLINTGFTVTALRESKPDPALFNDRKLYDRRCRVPLMLLLRAEK